MQARARVTALERELAQARAELEALESDAGSETASIAGSLGAPQQTRIVGMVDVSSSPAEKLELFQSRFAGRQDAYATRWVSRKTGRSGWSPAVKGGFYTDQKTDADLLPLTGEALERHLRGSEDERQPEFHVGLYPMSVDDRCKLLACDFDGKTWRKDAAAFAQACGEAGISALPEISRSGNGAHVWVFFETWVPATTARSAGMVLLRRAMQQNPGMPLDSYDRFFPAQDALPSQSPGRMRLGNLIALPLQGTCRRRGTTVFADPDSWQPYEDQFHALATAAPASRKQIEKLASEQSLLILGPRFSASVPKRPQRQELTSGLRDKTITIARGAMLHIPVNELPGAFISELKHRASISNPEFYRRQAQRFSTFGVPRLVTCFEYDDKELRLPRGLADETRQLLKKAGAKVTIRNTAKRRKKLSLEFIGELRAEQQDAVRALCKHRDGVLVAPPGSGKTVMACALITERQLPTAILVNRAELLHQWRQRLTTFLNIEDKQIGQLGSGRKKRKGIVDLIMMQSISRRDSDPSILEEYGQVIVDECHAIAAPSTEAAIRTVNVKYWAGLTATPFRADQMDGLITMQCGPVRHEMKQETIGERQLVVHQTDFTTEEPGTDGPSIQAIYSELSLDVARNRLIADRVLDACHQQRSSMVLTNRVEHLHALHRLLRPAAPCEVFTLHGQMASHERKEVRKKIAEEADSGHPFVLLAIDKVAGEGLDIPALDTLFLTMPVSFKGRIIQQAGRVTRGPTGPPEAAVVHDFRDPEVPLLERMHRKRRRTLENEGFTQEETPTIMTP